jgi:RluA family pseudouridine synthase
MRMMTTVRNGLRIVTPHRHTLEIRVKGRWFGRSLLDVLTAEFRSRDRGQYVHQILSGQILLLRQDTVYSGELLLESSEFLIRNKDILRVTTHKHEPPVIHVAEVPIVYQDDNVLVVNKPCSIPVHPTGKYYYNSLTEILKEQLSLTQIYPCHRLDKLTSGILVLAKTNDNASSIQSKIRDKNVVKYYLARVQGQFPESVTSLDRDIGVIDTKLGFKNGIKPKKHAVTEFQTLKYNPSLNQSIVLCRPLTGRTHQIRIHLSYLGFPIVNDPLYGPGSSRLRSQLINSQENITESQFNELYDEDMERLKGFKDGASKCEECHELLFNYDHVNDMTMWLHSYRFIIDEEYRFETAEPEWCNI